MLKAIVKYLEDNHCGGLYFTQEGCEFINHAQEMITSERIIIKEKYKILVPGCRLYLIKNGYIGGATTIINDEYCIFINKGIIEEQKTYLERMEWGFIHDAEERIKYIDKMIEYGFYFGVFHEYAHIFCGHIDAGLDDYSDIRAQECEADIFSMDYLVKYILFHKSAENYLVEIEKAFLAVYFLFEQMQKQDYRECYNNKLMENYYSDDKIAMRNHPLDAQRMLYLYESLNVVLATDKIQMLPIKENILKKLRIIKRLTDVELPDRTADYAIVNDSVQQLKKSIQDIRQKIPRIGNNSITTN